MITLTHPDGATVDVSAVWSKPRPIKNWARAFGVSPRTFYRRLETIDSRREFGGLCLRLQDCPPAIIAADLGIKDCQILPQSARYNDFATTAR